jgi:beta-xylosidase
MTTTLHDDHSRKVAAVKGVLLVMVWAAVSFSLQAQTAAQKPEHWVVFYTAGSGAKEAKGTFQDFWIMPGNGDYQFNTNINLSGTETGRITAHVRSTRNGDKLDLTWQWFDPNKGQNFENRTEHTITLSPDGNSFQGTVVVVGKNWSHPIFGHKG